MLTYFPAYCSIHGVCVPYYHHSFYSMVQNCPDVLHHTVHSRSSFNWVHLHGRLQKFYESVFSSTAPMASEPSHIQQQATKIDFLKWDCDQVSTPRSDNSISILDTATIQHPSALVSFTLDISCLILKGLASIQKCTQSIHSQVSSCLVCRSSTSLTTKSL